MNSYDYNLWRMTRECLQSIGIIFPTELKLKLVGDVAEADSVPISKAMHGQAPWYDIEGRVKWWIALSQDCTTYLFGSVWSRHASGLIGESFLNFLERMQSRSGCRAHVPEYH